MKAIKVKSLKNSQIFFIKTDTGQYHDFKCWDDPFPICGKWVVDCTCAGDYCYTFTEDEEPNIFVEDYPGEGKEIRRRVRLGLQV